MKTLPAILALAVLSASFPAQAHFDEPVPIGWSEWAGRQWNKKPTHCCAEAHAHLFKGRYEVDADGNVTAFFPDGQVTFIPKDRLVDIKPGDQNPTGWPVIWFDQIDTAFCFTDAGPLV